MEIINQPLSCASTSSGIDVGEPRTATSSATPMTAPTCRKVLLTAPPIDRRSGGSSATAAAELTGMKHAIPMGAGSVSNVGGSQAHDNMQPYLALNFCIALRGLFPSRN